MNDIIYCALISAGVLARHEPSGLIRSDSKRHDGVLVVPWRSEKFLVWDATSVDINAPYYKKLAVEAAGTVERELNPRKKRSMLNCATHMKKEEKFAELRNTHEFIPICMDSSCAFHQDCRHL